ncbi:DUF5719 family protein [Mycetocola sp.]|uniref:DUF5719 family protein n=1 Tax=Mycetocola sp. TaxID=1871042 RepID=UPI003988CD8B
MADKRRIAATSGRVLTGVLGAAVFLGVVIAVGQVQLPVVAVDAPKTTVTPTASDQFRLCPGPLLRQGGDASTGSFAQPAMSFAASSAPEQSALLAPDNVLGDRFGAPTVLSVTGGEGDERPQIGAAQSQAADLDDLTGFAATACGEVSADSWLVGGSTDVGRTTMLSLSNPNRADAVVDLSFFGETGAIEAPGAQGIIVPAGENRVLSVASFAPGVRTPVIRVQSSGGQVVAALQHSVTRGITPGGIELSLPTAAPSLNQVIPGVVLTDSAPVPDGEIYDDSIGALRLFVPGTEPAQVEISFLSEQGAEAPASLNYSIQGGVVQEVTLNELPAGSYSVSISSDKPLVASARTTAVAGESSDFAWFGASAALEDDIQLAVAPGEGATLHLSNPTSANLDVVLTDGGGTATQVAVPAGTAVQTTVRAGMAYSVSGVGGAYAQVSFTSAAGFSAYAIQPTNPLATPVIVYPR